jgi:hypothetical protein
MLVPRDYWEATAFLCHADDTGRLVPKGTAFFVATTDRQGVRVITAGHNVEYARASGKPLHLRVNRKGVAEDLECPDATWAESSATDLAACEFPGDPSAYEIKVLTEDLIVSDEKAAELRIGPGDEIFFCGLFSEHPGTKRSQPIVRYGNVSMMPGEKVRIRRPGGGERSIDAYLAETRSWGGQSGSPAFVYFPPDRELGVVTLPAWEGEPGAGGVLDSKAHPHLLGVVQGHFDISQDVAYQGEFAGRVAINAGIAVIIPGQQVLDLLREEKAGRER